MKGVAQTPPEVAWSEGNVHQGGNREGWAGPSCPGLSPSLPQPQACNTVWLQPWGWGDVPDGSVLGIGAHPRGTPQTYPDREKELKGQTHNSPCASWGTCWVIPLI